MLGIDKITKKQAKNYNILVFAYVGDAVYSLYIKSKFASLTYYKSGKLNELTNKVICAKCQQTAYELIYPILSKEELLITTTARNAQTKNIAPNCTIEEYKKSTSFEALLGYLYLTGQMKRLKEILEMCFEKFSKV